MRDVGMSRVVRVVGVFAVAVIAENGGGGSSVAGPVAREVIDAFMLPQLAAR